MENRAKESRTHHWSRGKTSEMASEGNQNANAELRNIIESVTGCESPRGQTVDNFAQLLHAIATQVGQSILGPQCQEGGINQPGAEPSAVGEIRDPASNEGPANSGGEGGNFGVNPQATDPVDFDKPGPFTYHVEDQVDSGTIEVQVPEKPRPICVKFPIEVRKKIISMRKKGMKSKDIAKEMKISVSGVQKVWERFLATGMIQDRKPSTYAGRPKKYTFPPRYTHSICSHRYNAHSHPCTHS